MRLRPGNWPRKPTCATVPGTWSSSAATARRTGTRGCGSSPWPTGRSAPSCQGCAPAGMRRPRPCCRWTRSSAAPCASRSITPASSATRSSGHAPSWSTRPWRRSSAPRRSRSPSCAASTKRSGARAWTRATSSATSRRAAPSRSGTRRGPPSGPAAGGGRRSGPSVSRSLPHCRRCPWTGPSPGDGSRGCLKRTMRRRRPRRRVRPTQWELHSCHQHPSHTRSAC